MTRDGRDAFYRGPVARGIDAYMRRIGGCFKLALDGCFGSEDAALVEPYANSTINRGLLYNTQQEVNDFCIRAKIGRAHV